MWDRDDVDFIRTQDLAWEVTPQGLLGAGGVRKVLSADPSDGAVTQLVTFRTVQHGRLTAGADVLALDGDGQLNGQPFGAGCFAYLPPGTEVEFIPGLPAATLYVGTFGHPRMLKEPGPDLAEIQDLETVPWRSPHWAGDTPLLTGAMMKPVRSGEHGSVYLSGMLPGWRSGQEEAHPVVEESFKLFGDILMGSRGVMQPGAYFFRGRDVFHGPLYTRTGTMSIVRSSGPTTTVFRDPPPGGALDDLIPRAWHGRSHQALTRSWT